MRPGSDLPLPDLPVGTRLRVLPNHACATAAQHDRYQVGDTTWKRVNGW
jgi:D-serine deaminase-like pyridoxal phosphate-dependent protein